MSCEIIQIATLREAGQMSRTRSAPTWEHLRALYLVIELFAEARTIEALDAARVVLGAESVVFRMTPDMTTGVTIRTGTCLCHEHLTGGCPLHGVSDSSWGV